MDLGFLMSKIVCWLHGVAAVCLFVFSLSGYAVSYEKVTASAFNSQPKFKAFGVTGAPASAGLITKASVASALKLGVGEDVVELASKEDNKGLIHGRFQQTYQGLPVWGQHITVHNQAGTVYKATGKVVRGLDAKLNSTYQASLLNPASYTTVTDDPYVKASLAWLNQKTTIPAAKWDIRDFSSSREIYIKNEQAYIARIISYSAYSDGQIPVRPVIIVDEDSHMVLHSWNALAHVDATGPGGNEKTGKYHYGSDYDALDVSQTESGCVLENDNVYTVHLNHSYDDTSTEAFEFECYENLEKEINGAYSPLNDAHYFGNVVFEMFQNWLGKPPLLFKLALKVHFGENYDNAYWNGSAMVFGDGQDYFYPLVDINVVSHEVSHGFTEQNSGLLYFGESGGINEAFSDIAGEAAEYYLNGNVDWLIGADISKLSPALRYFEDPTLDGISIGHADAYYEGMGVHHSSGVFNRAFYLLSNTQEWDVKKAFLAFAHANQYYWMPDTNFEDGACGVINSAKDLGYKFTDVIAAFTAVGVICNADLTDTDADGLPDTWEIQWGLDINDPNDAILDTDLDGLINLDEYAYQTNPLESDTDNDGLSDSDEIYTYGTSAKLADTDYDTMPDGYEIEFGFDPTDIEDGALDADGDGLSNAHEFLFGTNPLDAGSVQTPISFMYESFEQEMPADWTLENKGGVDWNINIDWSSHGEQSLSIAEIGFGQTASASYTNYFEAGELSFDYRVSTEYVYDYLLVIVDNKIVLKKSGVEQGAFSIAVEKGVHTVAFHYVTDSSVTAFEDRVWIDFVAFQAPEYDSDQDGITDVWEIKHGFNELDATDAALDPDVDGLSNLQEFQNDADPAQADTDGDGLLDGEEVHEHNTSPILPDSDGDLISDDYEIKHGLDPLDPLDALQDADGDGVENLYEYQLGTDPNNSNSVEHPIEFLFESFESGVPDTWVSTMPEGGALESIGHWSYHKENSLTPVGLPYLDVAVLKIEHFFDAGTLSFYHHTEWEFCCMSLQVLVDGELAFSAISGSSGLVSIDFEKGVHTIEFVFANHSFDNEGNFGIFLDAVTFANASLDHDSDGMATTWEIENHLEPAMPEDASEDPDGDGLTNLEEFLAVTNPHVADSDGDGLSDGDEVTLHATNPIEIDSDFDLIDDALEIAAGLDPNDPSDAMLDFDGDGMVNVAEVLMETDVYDASSYKDSLGYVFESFENGLAKNWKVQGDSPSTWESASNWYTDGALSIQSKFVQNDSSATLRYAGYLDAGVVSFDYRVLSESCCDFFRVYDNGQLVFEISGYEQGLFTFEINQGVHYIEFVYAKNEDTSSSLDSAWIDAFTFISNDPDSDGDGMPTEWELVWGFDPNNSADGALDLDGDGLVNALEFSNGTDPSQMDTDSDSVSDGDEVLLYGSSPLEQDSDGDQLDDGYEVTYGLNPTDAADADQDFDGDGATNLEEFLFETDPTDPTSVFVIVKFMHQSFEAPLSADWLVNNNNEGGWSVDSSWAVHGDSSMAALNVMAGDSVELSYSAYFDSGTFSFNYWVTENTCCDSFQLYVDNEILLNSSNTPPTQFSFQLAEGEHEIRFVFSRSPSSVNSAAWIDSILFMNENSDIDGDGIDSLWEIEYNLDPEAKEDGVLDGDSDGLSNYEEFLYQTNPHQEDTDADGLTDYEEVILYNTDPLLADSDGDALPDLFEVQFQLNPQNPDDAQLDNDGDGVTNIEEYQLGLDPSDAASSANRYGFFHESFEDGEISDDWMNESGSDVECWQPTTQWSYYGIYSLGVTNPEPSMVCKLTLTRLYEKGYLYFNYSSYLTKNKLQAYFDGNKSWQAGIGTRSGTVTFPISEGVHTLEILWEQGAEIVTSEYAFIDSVRFFNNNSDFDEDGLSNTWELNNGFDPEDPADGLADTDGDGLTNAEEYLYQSDYSLEDTDGDGLSDWDEVFVHQTSPKYSDSESDGIDDAYEIANGMNPNEHDSKEDFDGDGMSNLDEYLYDYDPNDPLSSDEVIYFFSEDFEKNMSSQWMLSSSDGVENWAYDNSWSSKGSYSLSASNLINGAHSTIGMFGYFDGGRLYFDYFIDTSLFLHRLLVKVDGVKKKTLYDEIEGTTYVSISKGYHTVEFVFEDIYPAKYPADIVMIDNIRYFSNIPDLDGDGMDNEWEFTHGLDPVNEEDQLFDLDGDGLNSLQEFGAGTDPNNGDTDGDGLSDGDEVILYFTSPNSVDTDGDGLEDGYEVSYQLDPVADDAELDADGDGLSNEQEFFLGTHPADATSSANPLYYLSESFEGASVLNWIFDNGNNSTSWKKYGYWATDGASSLYISDQNVKTFEPITASFKLFVVDGVLSFDYRTETLSVTNGLSVYLNDNLLMKASGSKQGSYSQPVTEGIYDLTFSYIRNSFSQSQQAYIDNIQFVASDGALDLDGDGMPNEWELDFGLDMNDPEDALADNDLDGASNYLEYVRDLDPLLGNINLVLDMKKISSSSSQLTYAVLLSNMGLYDATEIAVHHEVGFPEFDIVLPEESPQQCEKTTNTAFVCHLSWLSVGEEQEVRVVVYSAAESLFSSAVTAAEVDYQSADNQVEKTFAGGTLQWWLFCSLMLLAISRRYYR